LSSSCTTALGAVTANADANACLSPSSLISLAVGSANTSIIDPINTWVTNVCTRGACSNDTLAAIVTNITAGCSSELGTFGFDSSQTSTIISTVQEAYPTVRKVVCLKDGDTYCVTETLNNLQTSLGTTLSLSNIVSLFGSDDTQIPSNITCSDCSKAAYSIVKADYPALVSDDESDVQAECGASFTDGSSPSGISQTAPSGFAATSTDNDSAWGFRIGGQFAAVSAFLAVLLA
ncbi:hypothetical protein BDZ89DRAFT_954353, partial [Hymenopellis radicata]